jgi:glycosyltransferase involved in cell wall biosynthesis
LKLLLWEHSPPSKSKNSPKWLYAISASIFYQCADKVVTVSRSVYDDISRWSIGLKRKLVVISNPISPPHPRFSCRRRSAPAAASPKRVIYVGRLDQPKNPELLLDAFALLPDNCNATMQFIGEGRLRRVLSQKVKSLGIEGRVRFLGYQAEPYEFIASSDLLVVPSDREGFGNVLVEAMYCGLRVVSTDCGEGVREILLHGRYGTIVPPRDKYALARAIEMELKRQYSVQEQKEGAKRFLPDIIANRFLDLISA